MVNEKVPTPVQSLAAQQQLLVRLYTDESLRARMLGSPDKVLIEFGLDSSEASTWQALLPDFCLIAESLHFKRRAEARTLLPMTLAALGRNLFDELFLRYVPSHLPTGHRKPHDDAVTFGTWLLAQDEASVPLSLWQRDVIEFEYLCRRTMFRRWAFTARRLDHAVHLWNPTALPAEPPPRRRSLYVWWAWRGRHRWHIL